MSKCDFNKVANQLYWNHTSAWVFSCKLSEHLFKEHFWRAASWPMSCLLRNMMALLSYWHYSELKLCLWVILLPKFCNNSSCWHGLRRVTWSYDDDIIYILDYSKINRFMACLPNLVVMGLMEMEISIHVSILTWIPPIMVIKFWDFYVWSKFPFATSETKRDN